MRCNLDGVIDEDGEITGIVEIKSSSQPLKTDHPHEYHMPQIQHALAVTGLDYCVYAYHVVPMDRELAIDIAQKFVMDYIRHDYWAYLAQVGDLTVMRVERDDAYIERLIEHEAKFWSCVEMDLEPPPLMPEGEIEVRMTVLSGLLDAYGILIMRSKTTKSLKKLKQAKHR
jgi:hypothetical protein